MGDRPPQREDFQMTYFAISTANYSQASISFTPKAYSLGRTLPHPPLPFSLHFLRINRNQRTIRSNFQLALTLGYNFIVDC